MHQDLRTIIIPSLIGTAIDALTVFGVISYQKPSQEDLIREFYENFRIPEPLRKRRIWMLEENLKYIQYGKTGKI